MVENNSLNIVGINIESSSRQDSHVSCGFDLIGEKVHLLCRGNMEMDLDDCIALKAFLSIAITKIQKNKSK